MNVDQPTPTRRTLWVIYLAFCAATLIYAFIAKMVTRTGTSEPQPFPMPLSAILAAAAVGAIAMAYIIPRGTWAKAADLRLSDRDEALALYQTGMIMHWACLEAVAIIGFVLCIITYQWTASLAGSVVSLAFLASARPRPDNLGLSVD